VIEYYSSLFLAHDVDEASISSLATTYAANTKNTIRNSITNTTKIFELFYRKTFSSKLFWLWSQTNFLDFPGIIVDLLPPKCVFQNLKPNQVNLGNQ
jgi:hypothetical protein